EEIHAADVVRPVVEQPAAEQPTAFGTFEPLEAPRAGIEPAAEVKPAAVEPRAEDTSAVAEPSADVPQAVMGIEPVADVHASEAAQHPAAVERGVEPS